jgi:hypothetical protein
MGERQPDMQGDKACLGAGTDEDKDEDKARQGLSGGPDVGKCIAAGGAGKQARGQDKEAEGVVGQDDKVHGGEVYGVEGQDASWSLLVRAVADGEQAGAGGAQIGEDEKESAERVHAEPRADPRQADG